MKTTRVGSQITMEARYFNSNYHACAIVAVVTEEVDWAAYINGCDADISEDECIAFVSSRGAKLAEWDARHFFPDIELPYRG